MRDRNLPTITQYMKDHVDSSVDWQDGNWACPFHKEEHGKSFSIRGDIWRCFGQCQCGGDVISLHRHNYQLKTNEEAKKSLFYLYHIDAANEVTFKVEPAEPDEVLAKRKIVYNKAIRRANTPDLWVELDYILSKVPYDVHELEMFIDRCEHS